MHLQYATQNTCIYAKEGEFLPPQAVDIKSTLHDSTFYIIDHINNAKEGTSTKNLDY